MSLDLLKLDKQNDPRDGSQLKLPVLANQAQMSPPGVFTRGQGPTPSTPPLPFSAEQQQPAPPQQQQQPEQQATNPLEQVLNPDVSSLVNPYAGDLGKLSLGDVQRLGLPETIPSSIEEPEFTGKIGPDSSFEDIQKGVQTSYEKKRAGMEDSVNQVLANPTPVYAFPDPTAPIQINQRPTTEEYLYGSQGRPGVPQTSFGAEFNNNPFTQGNQGFSQNATAGIISQGGGLVSRLGNALHFDDKFGEYAKKDVNNIGNFLDPRAWFKYGTAYGNALQGKASWASVEKETPLFKLFENVGGDNGSYGPGLIGSTFRALDLVDNTVRGTVADIFQQKRLGEKTGNNLYRATVGGQDYSSFQVRAKGASPFALIPEKFDVNNPSHWGLGLGAFVIDAATGVVTGAGLGKILKNTGKVQTLLRGGQLAPTPSTPANIKNAALKSQILRSSGQTPVNVPVPKTPINIYNQAIAAQTKKVNQTVTLLQTPKGSLAKAAPLAPVKKTSSKPKLVVEPKTVTIQTPASIRPVKAPFDTQVVTDPTPTLVPPKPSDKPVGFDVVHSIDSSSTKARLTYIDKLSKEVSGLKSIKSPRAEAGLDMLKSSIAQSSAPKTGLIEVRSNGKIVGALNYKESTKTIDIAAIGTTQELKGSGAALVDELKKVAAAKGKKLTVDAPTEDSYEFYKKQGFTDIEEGNPYGGLEYKAPKVKTPTEVVTPPTGTIPRRVLDPFAMKNTAIILDEIARRKAGGPITKAINEVPFSAKQGTQRVIDEVARQRSPGVISEALDSIPTPQVYKDGTEALIREKIRQADNPIPRVGSYREVRRGELLKLGVPEEQIDDIINETESVTGVLKPFQKVGNN
jgi:hypothetical protein